MKQSGLLAAGTFALLLAIAVPSRADVAPAPATGGSAANAAAGSGSIAESGDEGGCSVAFARNTSAVAAGLIALALAIGMHRLQRYGMR